MGNSNGSSKLPVTTMMDKQATENMGKYELKSRVPEFMKTQRVPDIKVVECPLPENKKHKYAIILENVFSEDECQAIVDFTKDNLNYSIALLNVGNGIQVLDDRNRNHQRAIYDTNEISGYIFERIKGHLPQQWKDNELRGLNERLRFLHYKGGEYFKPHFDGSYMRDDKTELSYLTVLFYLNEGYEGGRTNFINADNGERFPVPVKTGSILIFEHRIFHEGGTLKKGEKYLMRTDVMYDNSNKLEHIKKLNEKLKNEDESTAKTQTTVEFQS